jgi:2-methylcitrate dehydratase PrpD
MTTENVSRRIAAFVTQTRLEDLPGEVVHEAKRSLLNYVACAIAGSGEHPVETSLKVLAPFGGSGPCRIIGRRERADMLLAAYVNAASANIFDYDDTHQETVIHPTAPVAPALFAFSEVHPRHGRDLLRAFILGGEIECRIGNAISPSHYARGWHITSTCGIFGAAIGTGVLAGGREEEFVWAMGNAAAQASGLVETLGTMSKSISVGNAARNGIVSALLAGQGYSGPDDPLWGTRGFLRVYSDEPGVGRLLDGLGEQWEIAKNTYKPYPAGIVLHPVIEACIRLHVGDGVRSEDVTHVSLTGHPLLRQRADRPDVTTGRLSQVSAQHAIAIALRRGKAGLAEFSDDAVGETLRDGIRPRITFVDDPARAIEAVSLAVVTRDGRTLAIDITAAKGGPRNPMTDVELEQKLRDLAAFRGFEGDVGAIADALWGLDNADTAASVMQLFG